MNDGGDDRGDSGGSPPDRAQHWEELKHRRRERDRRLDELEAEGAFETAQISHEEKLPGGGILEKMRAGPAGGMNPVYEREQEATRQAARMRARAQRGLAGIFLVLVAAVAVYTLTKPAPYEVTASFQNASQVVGDEEVTVGGSRVGTVRGVSIGDDGSAELLISIDDSDYAPLQRGTIATIRSKSLSGVANRQVQLTLPPSNAGGEEIPDGGTMDQSETVSEVDLDQIFNTLDPDTVSDLKKVIRGFQISYSGVGPQANKGFHYLNPFLSSSRRTFAELTRDQRSLERLIVDGAQLTGAVASRKDDVSALIGNLDLMMNAIGRQKTSLATAINQLPDFMRNFNTTAVNLRATLDDVDPLVDASKPVAVELRPFFHEFRSAAANLVPTVRDLDTIVESPGANNDLVDLTKLQSPLTKIAIGPVNRNGSSRLGAFPESVNSLTDGLDELAFFRAYTPELTGWFNDFGPTSGIADANGGLPRISTTFNTFSVSSAGVPVIDLVGGAPFGADSPVTINSLLDTGNTSRCPGANERPAPDGSNPFTESDTLNCDPSQIPPGP